MTNVTCLSRRLTHVLVQTPICTAGRPQPHRSAVTWIRTITQTPSRANSSSLTVSFGAENDAVLAPHLQKLQEKEIRAKSRKNGKSAARNVAFKADPEMLRNEVSSTSGVDHFEIDDFVDLSADTLRSSRTMSARTTADTNLEPGLAYSKRSRPVEKDSTNLDRSSRKEGSVSRRDRDDEPITNAKSDSRTATTSNKREAWQIQKDALKEKFGDDGWNPRKKLSPDAIEGIRGLHEQDPNLYSTSVLASQFKVSPEAIRRILKSKWSRNISPEQIQERRERWARRHDRIWDRQAELGLRPQRVKERELEDPDQFEKDIERRRILGDI